MSAEFDPVLCARLVRNLRQVAANIDYKCKECGCSSCADCDCSLRHAERDRYTRSADQIEVACEIIDGLTPQRIQALADENDRLRKAFDETIKSLQAGGSAHSGFCCWCQQHWPHLDGESMETFRKYTMAHAEVCPANDVRIARDAALAEVSRLTAELARVKP